MSLHALLIALQIALALANVILAVHLTIELRRVKALEGALLQMMPRLRRRLRLKAPRTTSARVMEPGTDPTIGFRDPSR